MRRGLRRAAVVLAMLAALALAVRAVVSFYAERRLERARASLRDVVGPLDPVRLELPEIPDDDNAAFWIQRAAVANDAIPWDERLGDLAATPSTDWDEEDLRLAREALQEREDALDLLSRARLTGGSTYRIPYRKGFSAELPDLMGLLRVGRLAVIAGRRAILEESPAELLESVEILRVAARSLCREPTILTLMIGSAIDRSAMTLMHERLARGGLAAVDWPAHLEALAPEECGQDSLVRAMTAEAIVFSEVIPALPPAEIEGDLHWLGSIVECPVGRIRNVLGTAATLELRQRQIENLALPFSEFHARWTLGELYPDSLASTYVFEPNLLDAIGKVKATETVAGLARAAVTAAMEYSRTGQFPSSISLESTPYADEVPVYSPFEGGAEISAPRSEQLWSELNPEGTHRSYAPVFRWSVAG